MLILYALPLFGADTPEAEAQSGVAPEQAKLTVKVKLKDAERFGRMLELRRELGKTQRKMAELTGKYRGLEKDYQLLRQEFIEITKNFQAQNESYRRLQLGIAATLASSKMETATYREGQLVKALADTFDSSRKLALKTVEFCDIVDALLKQMPIGKIRQAEFSLRAEELKKGARKLTTLADLELRQRPVNRCRILAVNKDLQVVVLPVGSVHGIFNGLNYYVGKDTAQLRIIMVRPFVSAAVPVKGSIESLAPGMEAVTDAKNVKE
ncbi:MAG: hypothetical protein PHV59_12970 [Victivallales bacterium]|nr:hypothetical protein [Victivallales bacterium]